jgi:predicted NUDIX family phosphoesterase
MATPNVIHLKVKYQHPKIIYRGSSNMHAQHIVCLKAVKFQHRKDGLVEYTVKPEDVFLGQRAHLEHDTDFRQLLPVVAITCNGRVWAYRRTVKGGESRLHGKVATLVGGHFDAEDVVWSGSVINLGASIERATQREVAEEINIKANIVRTFALPQMICADDTEVDRVHIAMVTVIEVDAETVYSKEDQLEALGFIEPGELLANDSYELETWARLTCEIMVNAMPVY